MSLNPSGRTKSCHSRRKTFDKPKLPEYFEVDPVDRSLAADVLLREEPDEDEDEEEDNSNDEGDDEYDGYSE